jgi:hypothetical protein
MPRVKVTTDDGDVMLDEHVRVADFDAAHFRRCLVDRLGWATEDAEVVREGTPEERRAEPHAAAAAGR